MAKALEQGSKTWKNLEAALAGESQAAVRYGFFASQAKKDGYEQIKAIFEETAGAAKFIACRNLRLIILIRMQHIARNG